LWLWAGQALYVGPSLGLDPHSGSVACLAAAAGGTFHVVVDGAPGPAVRTALIPPRLRHHVVADAELMAFCYLDAGSDRHRACSDHMTGADGPIAYGHRHEQALCAAAVELADADGARAWLDLAGPRADHSPARATDPRIRDALVVLREHSAANTVSTPDLAAVVGLSQSRFLHLFRDHAGTSLRRYRLWLRMLRAAELLAARTDLTTAAVGAGFASPSHFSSAFHSMFGLQPRQLLGVEIHPRGPSPSRPPTMANGRPGPASTRTSRPAGTDPPRSAASANDAARGCARLTG
jgi:AraC-like DNA-binding protein